jgi:hypothetical protein
VAGCYNSSQILVKLAATRRRRRRSSLRICSLALASPACVLVGVVSTSANAGPSNGSASGNYLVVWAEEHGRSTDIYGARVSAEGSVLDRRGIPISTAKHGQDRPNVAFDGSNYLVVWTDDRSKGRRDAFERPDVYGARVTEAGVVLDRAGIRISTARGYQGDPSVAFDGSNFLVVWSDDRAPGLDIYGARVSRTGAVLDRRGFTISKARNEQTSPGVAFDGTNYFVVWEDSRSDSEDIVGARITTERKVLDPRGLWISRGGGLLGRPRVAFGARNYLVTWSKWRGSQTDVYGARLRPDGIVLDPGGLPISVARSVQAEPKIAFDGTNFLVAWDDGRGKTPDIYATRVSETGSVWDRTGRAIARGVHNDWSLSVAFNGANYLVAWEKEREEGISESRMGIFGARVGVTGSRVDRTPILIARGKRR